MSVAGLFRGVLGSKAWMAELGCAGGTATSARKAKTPRVNGTKGGWPQTRTSEEADAR